MIALKDVFDDFCDFFDQIDTSKSVVSNISIDNYFIKIEQLLEFGFPIDIIEKYHLENKTVNDLKDINFEEFDYLRVEKVLCPLKDSVIQLFEKALYNDYSERNIQIIIARSEGRTLQSIGKQFGMTRERVRQLCNKIALDLKDEASLLLSAIIKEEEKGCTIEEIFSFINDDDLAQFCEDLTYNCLQIQKFRIDFYNDI